MQALSQKTQRLPFGLTKEVFFVNLEYGYFGCQINETTDYLQIYELSKLCDGVSDCFMGSDELRKELKCSSKYIELMTTRRRINNHLFSRQL